MFVVLLLHTTQNTNSRFGIIHPQTYAIWVYHRHMIFFNVEVLKPCISLGRSCGGAQNFGNVTTTEALRSATASRAYLKRFPDSLTREKSYVD